MITRLSENQIDRYSRQIILDDVQEVGQLALLNAKVVVIGAGGIGCPLLSCLIGAGVGHVFVCDPDRVELANLARQTLYSIDDLDSCKVDCVKNFAAALNPDVVLSIAKQPFEPALIPFRADLVIDTSDQHDCRCQSARYCFDQRIPYLTAAVQGNAGLLFQQNGDGSCFPCLFPNPPDPALVSNCELTGIFASVTTTLGGMLAQQAFAYLLSGANPTRLLLCELGTMTIYPIAVSDCDCRSQS